MLTPRSHFLKPSQKKSYLKPFLSVDEQICKLKERGMTFENEVKAKQYLENINYYRLSGYWLIYQKENTEHLFYPKTSFERVLDIYVFDRELRVLFLEAIERIEVSIRTKFAHILSQKYGSHFHLNPELFFCPIRYAQTLVKLNAEIFRSKEPCVAHFKSNYKEKLPPIYSSIELMTLGQMSHWLDNLKYRKDKQLIAKQYDLDEKVLTSFLHHLTIIRNISAHHSRLWNKKFTLDFVIPKNPENLNKNFNHNHKKYLYNSVIMVEYILKQIDENSDWMQRIMLLTGQYKIDKKRMGFK